MVFTRPEILHYSKGQKHKNGKNLNKSHTNHLMENLYRCEKFELKIVLAGNQ